MQCNKRLTSWMVWTSITWEFFYLILCYTSGVCAYWIYIVIGTASLLTVSLTTFILYICCRKKSISKGQRSTNLQGVESTVRYMDLMKME